MGPGMEVQTFERGDLTGRRFFFRVVDTGNAEILAASQTYKTMLQRDRTAKRLAAALGCAVKPGKRR